jgi:hypothetical protein
VVDFDRLAIAPQSGKELGDRDLDDGAVAELGRESHLPVEVEEGGGVAVGGHDVDLLRQRETVAAARPQLDRAGAGVG